MKLSGLSPEFAAQIQKNAGTGEKLGVAAKAMVGRLQSADGSVPDVSLLAREIAGAHRLDDAQSELLQGLVSAAGGAEQSSVFANQAEVTPVLASLSRAAQELANDSLDMPRVIRSAPTKVQWWWALGSLRKPLGGLAGHTQNYQDLAPLLEIMPELEGEFDKWRATALDGKLREAIPDHPGWQAFPELTGFDGDRKELMQWFAKSLAAPDGAAARAVSGRASEAADALRQLPQIGGVESFDLFVVANMDKIRASDTDEGRLLEDLLQLTLVAFQGSGTLSPPSRPVEER